MTFDKLNSASSVYFWNSKDNRLQANIWQELRNGLWKNLSIDAYLSNELLPSDELAKQKPLFEGFQQIIPGTTWNERLHHLELDLYKPQISIKSLTEFIDLCGEYIQNLKAQRIGVHLSGGLDSSIIICILKTLGIPFVPIGYTSYAYEFRTERYIQEKLLNYGQDGALINLEEYPFYSCLMEIPPHQIPMANIKNNASCKALAKAFYQHGCDIVFTGQGGDTIFVDAVKKFEDLTFNIGNEFENRVEQELYYGPSGIQLIPFFANHQIIDALSTASIGRKEDVSKKWARSWFAPILPNELVEYTYCADFFGVSVGSLEREKPTIRKLFEEAYDISKKDIFSSANTSKFINQDVFSFEYKDYIKFCSLLSVAVWYHSLTCN